ncbi:50S ribosomal protein L29 [Symbiobacterium thermophilum]|jgi:large subunit ribosomal protein L29|uniref:Large ribosomal subunit protein uL29 n=2 Tax=Symbiobacterium thermophilum TaxID=2734 RepID=RL29_SYMTH|nr:50S ribosomal protein L29 [Symbiobacterium thermophilum]Q67JV1.1 RecName: Full=Large ribosomal subunit protein uL29; AltName: Full=50S ribosomal protein L29 [Symbiobacterium thermophilum IAM 14863]MBY6274762.1 50S ribosomal protein L29 [Symbiobacterium thermophilum]BAD42049.1 50S ribosomal protein L29 [Symbiobacterium thermophilum IAM 14863]
MKVKEIREMSTEEIKAKVAELKEELFNLRFQLAVNNLENTARIREVRRAIAQCKTVIRERELKAQGEVKA